MEKYVVSRELAEKLKGAGYPQKAQFFIRVHKPNDLHMLYTHEQMIVDNDRFRASREPNMRFREENEFFAAPLSDELLEVLPFASLMPAPKTGDFKYQAYAISLSRGIQPAHREYADKPADALAKLYLWCKEHNYV